MIRKIYVRLLVRFITKKMSNIDNEVSLRLLNHAILLEMVKLDSTEIEMTYEAELPELGELKVITTSKIMEVNKP